MRSLVLVDLDNLIAAHADDERGRALPWPAPDLRDGGAWIDDPGMGPRAGLPASPRCVVTIALNTVTARAVPVPDRGYLERFAVAVAGALRLSSDPAAETALEIALTLPAPQTSDVALQRLLLGAPIAAHAMELERVILISRDRGLREGVAGMLGIGSYRRRSIRALDTVAFLPTSEAGRLMRKWIPQRHVLAGLADPIPRYSTRIRTDGEAAWASTQPLDAAVVDLGALARRVEERPGILSQVGITASSVNGVGRLSRPSPQIGACSASDGLEFQREKRLGGATSVQPASVGPGAAFVSGCDATLATRLPWQVHAAIPVDSLRPSVEPPLTPSLGRIDDDATIRAVPGAVGCGRVRIRSGSRQDLIAEVLQAPALWLDLWFYVRDPRREGGRALLPFASSSIRVAGGPVVPGDFSVPATAMPLNRQLVLRSPVSPRSAIRVAAPIPPRTIAAVELDGDWHALLAPDRTLVGAIEASPIQLVSATRLARQFPALDPGLWPMLANLPLLVPAAPSE